MPWLSLQGSLDGVTILATETGLPTFHYFELSGQESLDSSGGIVNTASSIDQTVFRGVKDDLSIVDIEGGNEPYRGIQLPTPGLYYIRGILGWFQDWGKGSINIGGSGTGSGVLDLHLRLDSTETTWFGFGGFPHTQIGLTVDTFLAIDEDTTDREVRLVGRNESGFDRTWDSSDNIGGITLDIIQLSSLGDSNP